MTAENGWIDPYAQCVDKSHTISRLPAPAQSYGLRKLSILIYALKLNAKTLNGPPTHGRLLIAAARFDPLSALSLTIRQSGIDTTFASDFPSCCVALLQEPITAVLLDAKLLNDPPNQPGYELLMEPTTPVVLLCENESEPQESLPMGLQPYRIIHDAAEPQETAELLVGAVELGRLRTELAEQVKKYELRRATLSQKELFVLDSFIAGWTNRRIASHQDVSVRTVEHRRRSIYNAFETDSASVISYQAGLAACARAFLDK